MRKVYSLRYPILKYFSKLHFELYVWKISQVCILYVDCLFHLGINLQWITTLSYILSTRKWTHKIRKIFIPTNNMQTWNHRVVETVGEKSRPTCRY